MKNSFDMMGAIAAVLLASTAVIQADDNVKNFQVLGTNPGGKGGYKGKVEVRKQGDTMAVQWTTGPKAIVTNGLALKGENVIAVGYGKSLWGIAVYEKKGNRLKAKWVQLAKPEEVGEYELKGEGDFSGSYSFTNGTPGKVVMKPADDGTYKISWELASGHFEGIALRSGDTLVAVSGEPGGNLGVAAYGPKGDDIVGAWSMLGVEGLGKEVWSLPDAAGATASKGAPDGQTLSFGGDTYLLKNNQSAPGQPTQELREYLRDGEDWDGYRKMLGFRLMPSLNDAGAVAQGTLEKTKKDFADSYTKEILISPERAVIMFIIISKADVELNMWELRRTPLGVASAQFVMRNKPPYETREKFKAEQDANFEDWQKQLTGLAENAVAIIGSTVKAGGAAAPKQAATPAPEKAPSPDDAALAEKIGADMQKCSVIAQNFVELMKAGKVADAVGLMSDNAFEAGGKEALVTQLTKSSKVLGALKDVTPDKKATDFGVNKNGVMTFTLVADVEYENATMREIFGFIRNEKGGQEFVSYNRKAKK